VSIEFALRQKETPFGWVSDPRIPLRFRTAAGSLTLHFLIDTGADFSVAPRRLAALIGLDWARLPDARITGIGAGSLPVRVGRLPVEIAGRRIAIRCFLIDSTEAPLLLGRVDFLDHFVLTIDQPRRRIILDDADR
jgi:predicted aspartyl protease